MRPLGQTHRLEYTQRAVLQDDGDNGRVEQRPTIDLAHQRYRRCAWTVLRRT